jgi:hypothetical protein
VLGSTCGSTWDSRTVLNDRSRILLDQEYKVLMNRMIVTSPNGVECTDDSSGGFLGDIAGKPSGCGGVEDCWVGSNGRSCWDY